MIGNAIIEVTYPGEEPYLHLRTWHSEGWEHAPVELMEWIKDEEESEGEGFHLKVIRWTLRERADIGV